MSVEDFIFELLLGLYDDEDWESIDRSSLAGRLANALSERYLLIDKNTSWPKLSDAELQSRVREYINPLCYIHGGASLRIK